MLEVLSRALYALAVPAPRMFSVDSADDRAVSSVRRPAARICEELDLEHLADDAVLVSSELVTNVIRHGRTAGTLLVGATGERLRIEVIDRSPEMPAPVAVDGSSPDGRGMNIVSALTVAWGVDILDVRQRIRAEVGSLPD